VGRVAQPVFTCGPGSTVGIYMWAGWYLWAGWLSRYLHVGRVARSVFTCGPGTLVGIATDYEMDGSGSNPGEDEIFRQSRPAMGPTQPPVQWVRGLSRG